MAAWLDNVKFNPTAGGITDFTASTTVPGYQSMTAAGANSGTAYRYFAISADFSQWELGVGTFTGTGITRATVLYNSLGTTAKVNFTNPPVVSIVAVKEDMISIEEANSFTAAQQRQARQNINADPGMFAVDRNGTDQTGLTAAAYNKITWTNTIADNRTWFSLATGRYTPQVAGLYIFCLQTVSNLGTGNEGPQSAIYKNGTRVKNGTYSNSGSMATSVLTCAVLMNGTTDYIEAYAYLPTSITTLTGNAISTHFEGWLAGV